MSWYEPDDDDLGERAGDAGYIDPDTAETLRALLRHVNIDPHAGSRHDAALVLIEYHLQTTAVDENDPTLVWARKLLSDVVG